ncbi:deoxyribodipyrimidine photolyase-related protein [Halolactibacillus halophilus]|uniref:(6-4) photolyase n=1 Tax=Halolactibacillus halophilus TaxID=306540 RepID=A0A1I5NLN5_9BACI|nr:cryptochrome/photolyase family protein [Halolactibacillus halophilus]GEM01374.1 (6-4) photolyase [Halolactibacillus halophilus]SFP22713.1 deoxyribodipyrimidine photolyase-related protein [Halolactibacillus halophilus]
MKTLWLFGNQLSTSLKGLSQINQTTDQVLLIEAKSRAVWKDYHKKKLVLIFSAMRHFARELRALGYQVDYREVDSFQEGWDAHVKDYQPAEVILHLPTDQSMRQLLRKWKARQEEQGRHVTTLEASLFITKEADWEVLLPGNKAWKLDNVYRHLRKKFSILMDGNQPIGGKWSYDSENRKPPKKGLQFVEPLLFLPDEQTRAVIAKVDQTFPMNPGTTQNFTLPVTRKQAQEAAEHFIQMRLATFGDYQDAMIEGDPYMSHSLISSALNIGLLDPLEMIHQAEQAYHDGLAPLAAVEGFIRQILGWREYVRGVYLLKMPEYKDVNFLKHKRPLPRLYWDGETKMNCLHQTVTEVIEYGYSHHIQRLMVLGNFANLAQINPQDVSEWFNTMYTDAHDWVVLPNVLGMALYADGGLMSTKPYVSSGQYINKMSNYCKGCYFNVKEKTGERACPFNSLYWDYLMVHEDVLASNPRMKMMYRLLEKKSAEEKAELKNQARLHLERLEQGQL